MRKGRKEGRKEGRKGWRAGGREEGRKDGTGTKKASNTRINKTNQKKTVASK